MILQNELRVGNYWQHAESKRVFKIDVPAQIVDASILGEGVPLTPEILIKSGFADPSGNGLAYRKNINASDEVCNYLDDNTIRLQTIRSGFTRKLPIKYLHELQNWWRFHTGEELQITEI